jgi:RNA polymerase sigma factor (sigma-70 family)
VMGVQAPGRADDRRLAESAAAGDASAFEAIFERHHRGLLSLCRHLLGSREEAEDALQHTFAVAYRELVQSGPPRHLRAWLYATARNRCLDILRRRRELPAALPAAATEGLPEEVERRSDLRELVDDIGRLPEDQRAALVLSELGDMPHAEVADVLGCGRDKVRALVYQARSALAGWREARALPCRAVREEIAIARGAGLRRGHLRRHLKVCRHCAAFRQDVDRQRRRVAALLPVVPALGLKARVLEAALGGGGAAAGGGGAAAGGGLAAGTLGAPAAKIGAAALVLGVAGIATFGGLPGGGGPSGGGAAPDRAPSAAPAAAQQPAADRDARPAERRPESVRRTTEKRLRVREQQQTEVSSETVDPKVAEQVEPAPPDAQPTPPDSSEPAPTTQPEPPSPAPTPEPAPAPPGSTEGTPPAENRSAAPQAELEAEVEVDPPDSLP